MKEIIVYKHKALIFIIFAVSVLAAACAVCKDTDMTAKCVKERLQKDLKPGVSDKIVIQVLDKKNIEHSKYLESENKIFGIIRSKNNYTSVLIIKSIQLIFTFNDKRELVKIDVKEVFTGP